MDEYQYTPYYNLPLYTDATPNDMRDGYNRAMNLIDLKLHQLDVQLNIIKNLKWTRKKYHGKQLRPH